MFATIIDWLNTALYSYVLIILLIVGGIYFTVRTRFAQFRLLGKQFKAVTEKNGSGVSSFQALMVSTASRVGTGNIPVILYLGKYAYRALRDYEHKSAEGLKMTFRKKDIGLTDETDYWN